VSEACPAPPATLPTPAKGDAVATAERLTRIYTRGGFHPTTWPRFRHDGPLGRARFDHHPEPFATDRAEGVMYLASASKTRGGQLVSGLETALAESFQDTRVIDRNRANPWCVIWTPTRPLNLLDLDSRWTARAGGNAALTSGPRDVSREWARAIHTQLPDLDGLTWRSSVLTVGQAIVLFERAKDTLPNLPDLNRSLADPAMHGPVTSCAANVGYLVIP
jgi:hypothetical protein